MYYKRPLLAIYLVTGLCFESCQRGKPFAGAPPVTAVLRFENLSGSAIEDWQGRALSELLQRRFGSNRVPHSFSPSPGISTERLAAIGAGATRIITGYFTSNGASLIVTAFAEDIGTQKLAGPIRATGSLSAVAASLANQLEGVRPATLNPDSPALPEYSKALDTTGQKALQHYDLAVQADPDFGPAYLGALQTAATVDTARVQPLLTLAAAHSAKFSPEDRAYLQLESATLARDAQGRVQALASLAATNPQDTDALRTLADAEMSSHKAADAARHYRQLTATAPTDPNLQNLLAYSALFAGDEPVARAAALEYQHLRPRDPNAFDTQGDVEFAFGHFVEAGKFYLASPDQNFQDFSPSWKAAQARFFAGDVSGANAIFEKHRALLASASAPAASYRAAHWNYLTGHAQQATSAMAELGRAQTDQPQWRAMAFTQAAIWALIAGDPAHAAQWSDLALHPAQQATFAQAALARFLAQPSADAATWQRRAESSFHGPDAAALSRLALGYALIMTKDFPAAAPVWKNIYDATNVNDMSTAYFYGWTLLETGHPTEAAPLLKLYPIPPPGIAPTFDALYITRLAEWRKSSLRQ